MTDLPRLLKRLYRFRRDAARGGWARLQRRRRKAALVAELRRCWPGGYVLTDRSELAYVPAPLDARGEHVMFYGFAAPPGALAFVPAGGAAIDIGANLGEWAVPLARSVGPEGRVLCCEPNPSVAAALAATLAINNMTQARVLAVAVAAADGDGRLAIEAADSGQSRLSDTGLAISLRSLDSLVAEVALERIDLIKIDVEGHEAAVLAGATRSLARFRPAVIFESGHESGCDRERIADLLVAQDYELVAALHDYGALSCTIADYRAARAACAGSEPRNLLALPLPATP
jgi:FkbM family methyltransferase